MDITRETEFREPLNLSFRKANDVDYDIDSEKKTSALKSEHIFKDTKPFKSKLNRIDNEEKTSAVNQK